MPQADLYELAEKYRPQFPIFKSSICLNTCSLGALSLRARAALAEFADLWDCRGASAYSYRPTCGSGISSSSMSRMRTLSTPSACAWKLQAMRWRITGTANRRMSSILTD